MKPNNDKETWQTVGAIVSSLSGIIVVILQLNKLTALVKRILKWIWGRWSMLRQWWYWKRRSPLCSISGMGSFQINWANGDAEIEIKMNWQSRIKTIDKTVIEGSMLLGIGGTIPKLSCYLNILVLNPQEKKENIVYKFRGNVHVAQFASLEDSIKQIGSVVRCKIKVEKIWIRGLLEDRSINMKSFKANVKSI